MKEQSFLLEDVSAQVYVLRYLGVPVTRLRCVMRTR